MLALERVCELTTDLACVESFVTDEQPSGAIPAMEFYEGTELAGQFDNWVGPNISCLMAMCRTAGFARVDFKSVVDHRAHVICHRKWPETRADAARGRNCWSSKIANCRITVLQRASRRLCHGVVSCSEEPDLTCDDLLVQVGPYGTRPAAVRNIGTTWQANCKLPLGLAPGWHDVSVALRDSEFSSPARIPVDLPKRRARLRRPQRPRSKSRSSATAALGNGSRCAPASAVACRRGSPACPMDSANRSFFPPRWNRSAGLLRDLRRTTKKAPSKSTRWSPLAWSAANIS